MDTQVEALRIDEPDEDQVILRFVKEGFTAHEIRSFTNCSLERIAVVIEKYVAQSKG